MTCLSFVQGASWGMAVVILLVAGLIYFLPAIVARGNHNSSTVFWVNLLLGWTALGWVIALILAFTDSKPTVVIQSDKANKYDQLEKLNQLREKGVISNEEFIIEKEKIMKV